MPADQAQASTDVQFTGTTKGTRSKRQRTVKSYAIVDQDAGNDENDCQVANTPMNPPTAVKKLRILGPTPHSSQTAVKREPGKSTVKREHGKSTIKKELERFLLVSLLVPITALLHSVFAYQSTTCVMWVLLRTYHLSQAIKVPLVSGWYPTLLLHTCHLTAQMPC